MQLSPGGATLPLTIYTCKWVELNHKLREICLENRSGALDPLPKLAGPRSSRAVDLHEPMCLPGYRGCEVREGAGNTLGTGRSTPAWWTHAAEIVKGTGGSEFFLLPGQSVSLAQSTWKWFVLAWASLSDWGIDTDSGIRNISHDTPHLQPQESWVLPSPFSAQVILSF